MELVWNVLLWFSSRRECSVRSRSSLIMTQLWASEIKSSRHNRSATHQPFRRFPPSTGFSGTPVTPLIRAHRNPVRADAAAEIRRPDRSLSRRRHRRLRRRRRRRCRCRCRRRRLTRNNVEPTAATEDRRRETFRLEVSFNSDFFLVPTN